MFIKVGGDNKVYSIKRSFNSLHYCILRGKVSRTVYNPSTITNQLNIKP